MHVNSSDGEPVVVPINWDELHAGYMRGDDAQAEQLFGHITKHQLPRILRGMDKGLTEDQVAELVARINYKLHHEGKIRLYKGPLTFLGWLRMVAARERADFFREKQRTGKVIAGSADDETAGLPPVDAGHLTTSIYQRPGRSLVTDEILKAIAACFERLPSKDRLILERRAFGGEEYEQLAASMGTHTDNAYLLLHRAREKLMTCLEKSGVRVPLTRKSMKEKRGKDVSS